MVKLFRGNETVKGITFSLLSLIILESGTVWTLAALHSIRKWDINENIQYFYLSLVFNSIIAGLLGVGIAKKFRNIKKIAYILNIIVFIMIIAGYAYFVWYRFSHNV